MIDDEVDVSFLSPPLFLFVLFLLFFLLFFFIVLFKIYFFDLETAIAARLSTRVTIFCGVTFGSISMAVAVAVASVIDAVFLVLISATVRLSSSCLLRLLTYSLSRVIVVFQLLAELYRKLTL